MAVEVIDGFNVITARHLERLAHGELIANGSRPDWARLMRRTLAVDPLRCPRCSSRLRPIAEITEPEVIAGSMLGSRCLQRLAFVAALSWPWWSRPPAGSPHPTMPVSPSGIRWAKLQTVAPGAVMGS